MAEATCTREGCERPAHTKGLCKSHYTLHRRGHPDRPLCSIDGCDRPRFAKSLCQPHYQQTPEQRERHRTATRDYARRNRVVAAEKHRAWRIANPEKARAQRRRWMAKWRSDNRDAAREAFQRWVQANPDRWAELQRASQMKRRAQKKGTQVEPIDLARVLAEHGLTCHICGGSVADMTDLHFDHVIPLARGGTHTYDNLRPAHALCNMRKGARAPA